MKKIDLKKLKVNEEVSLKKKIVKNQKLINYLNELTKKKEELLERLISLPNDRSK